MKCLRIILIGVAVVLATSSVASADIGQLLGFSIGASNLVQRSEVGSAEGANLATVALGHQAFDGSNIALQEETGILAQVGITIGTGGVGSINQNASASAIDFQFVSNPAVQGALKNVQLNQNISEIGGPGSATGTQTFVGAGTQVIVSPDGMLADSEFIGAAQHGGVSAADSSSASVNSTLDITAGKFQATNGDMIIQPPVMDP